MEQHSVKYFGLHLFVTVEYLLLVRFLGLGEETLPCWSMYSLSSGVIAPKLVCSK